jgi:hypothetical protein
MVSQTTDLLLYSFKGDKALLLTQIQNHKFFWDFTLWLIPTFDSFSLYLLHPVFSLFIFITSIQFKLSVFGPSLLSSLQSFIPSCQEDSVKALSQARHSSAIKNVSSVVYCLKSNSTFCNSEHPPSNPDLPLHSQNPLILCLLFHVHEISFFPYTVFNPTMIISTNWPEKTL